jgi:hypothetical protein
LPVAEWQVGFLQTVYKGERIGYYQPAPERVNPLLGLIRGIFGTTSAPVTKYKRTISLGDAPVRDGFPGGVVPWYGGSGTPVQDFGQVKESTKIVKMYDAPSNGYAWSVTKYGKAQNLVKTGGGDQFMTWMVAYNPHNQKLAALNFAEWKTDYGSSVQVNTKSPASSVVTITTGTAQVVRTGDGNGGKNPVMSAPVAINVAKAVDGAW